MFRCRPISPAARAADEQDRSDYQTIFAREEGSVAAPTAGLHFTEAIVQALAGARRRAAQASRCTSAPGLSCR